MRRLAEALTILTMAVLGIAFLLFVGTGLKANITAADALEASRQQAAFETISGAILSGDMGSDQFKKVTELNPADYEIITYRAVVRNPGLLGADWVRLKLSPTDRDVAVLTTPADIGPFGSTELTAQLLTGAGGDASRELWIEYYILGGKMSQAAVWRQNG
jgi:hypothetical protein